MFVLYVFSMGVLHIIISGLVTYTARFLNIISSQVVGIAFSGKS
jgi:branched-subunit amino acid transport protein